MRDIISDGLAIILACLVIAVFASAIIVFRPWKRRHRQRKRHSHRKRIDLFAGEPAEQGPKSDA